MYETFCVTFSLRPFTSVSQRCFPAAMSVQEWKSHRRAALFALKSLKILKHSPLPSFLPWPAFLPWLVRCGRPNITTTTTRRDGETRNVVNICHLLLHVCTHTHTHTQQQHYKRAARRLYLSVSNPLTSCLPRRNISQIKFVRLNNDELCSLWPYNNKL